MTIDQTVVARLTSDKWSEGDLNGALKMPGLTNNAVTMGDDGNLLGHRILSN